MMNNMYLIGTPEYTDRYILFTGRRVGHFLTHFNSSYGFVETRAKKPTGYEKMVCGIMATRFAWNRGDVITGCR